jgi:hypothetical protein
LKEAATKNAQNFQLAILSYCDILAQNSDMSKALAADPCLLAQEEIRKRQVLLDKDMDSNVLCSMDIPLTLKHLNEVITKINNTNDKGQQICSAQKLRNRGILIEMQNKDTEKWLQQKDIVERLQAELKHMVLFKKWPHNTIAFVIPLKFDPNSSVNVEEVQESNNIPLMRRHNA